MVFEKLLWEGGETQRFRCFEGVIPGGVLALCGRGKLLGALRGSKGECIQVQVKLWRKPRMRMDVKRKGFRGNCGAWLLERREEKCAWSQGGGRGSEAQGGPCFCARHSASGLHVISQHPYEACAIAPIYMWGHWGTKEERL